MEGNIYTQALSVAVSAAHKAGERIIKGYDEPLQITVKSDPVDRVTKVDTDAQQLIVETIQETFPDHSFLGEEELTRDGKGEDARYRWVIDPIDGTSNFIQGLPHCGTSIALELDGEPVVGVLHFPVFQTTYTAIKGEGAFCNDKPMSVRPCEDISKAVVAEIFSDRLHRGKEVNIPPCLAYRRFGSAITSLAYLAAGNIDGTALRCFRWDISAASVIIREAGGEIEWQYDDPSDERGVLTCAAASPGIQEDIKTIAMQTFLNKQGW